MDILVEIGNEEEKRLIRKELEFFNVLANKSDPPINLTRVIVAENIEKTVNKLEKRTDYHSVRKTGMSEVSALARVTEDGDGSAIVISSLIYTENHDSQTRFRTFFHELSHLLNKRDFPEIPEEPFSYAMYLTNLYKIFDEYVADRFAFRQIERVFDVYSYRYERMLVEEIQGYTHALNDRSIIEGIRAEVNSFRQHGNANRVEENIRAILGDLIIAIAHAFALSHHYPKKLSNSMLKISPFVNKKTIDLMDYLKDSDERGIVDLDRKIGVKLLADFISNFGLLFEDLPSGPYLHVLDIEL